jgi:SAM-dependent methyltransferase
MKNCLICNSENIVSLRSYKSKSELFLNKVLMKCNTCNLAFASPLPSDNELTSYNSKYFLNAHGGISTHPIVISFHSGINNIRANHILDSINHPNIKINKILEIGPGLGFIMEYFKKKYPDVEYSIIESDLENLEKLKKLASNYFVDIDVVPNNYFDLVIISHVLEHTNNPVNFLKKIKLKIRKGGYIFIEVPNEDYKFKNEDEPHLLFFNQNSMRILLEKSELNCIRISNHGPEIDRGFIKDFIFKLYNFLDYKLSKLGIQLPLYLLFPSLKIFLSPREILSVIPFEAIEDKKNPSWWLRVVAQKS